MTSLHQSLQLIDKELLKTQTHGWARLKSTLQQQACSSDEEPNWPADRWESYLISDEHICPSHSKWQHTLTRCSLTLLCNCINRETEQSANLGSRIPLRSWVQPKTDFSWWAAPGSWSHQIPSLPTAAGSTGYLCRTYLYTRDNYTRKSQSNWCYQDDFSNSPLHWDSAANELILYRFLLFHGKCCLKTLLPWEQETLSSLYSKMSINLKQEATS